MPEISLMIKDTIYLKFCFLSKIDITRQILIFVRRKRYLQYVKDMYQAQGIEGKKQQNKKAPMIFP